MFERFTDSARSVITVAQEQAREMRHDYIGTEHLLLGLLAQGEDARDVARAALEAFGVSRHAAREEVCEIIGWGQKTASGHIPFTPRAKKVLKLSLRESLQLGHDYIGPEHLLLALLREGEGVACQILAGLGVELNQIHAWLLEAVPHGSRSAGAVGGEPLRPPGREDQSFERALPFVRKWIPAWLQPFGEQLLIWGEPVWRLAYRNRRLSTAGLLGTSLVALLVLARRQSRRLAQPA